MVKAHIQSRRGNLTLGGVGGVYVIAAVVLFARFVTDMGSPPSTRELIVLVSLLLAMGCGAWFVVSALDNLGIRLSDLIHGSRGIDRRNTPRPV